MCWHLRVTGGPQGVAHTHFTCVHRVGCAHGTLANNSNIKERLLAVCSGPVQINKVNAA